MEMKQNKDFLSQRNYGHSHFSKRKKHSKGAADDKAPELELNAGLSVPAWDCEDAGDRFGELAEGERWTSVGPEAKAQLLWTKQKGRSCSRNAIRCSSLSCPAVRRPGTGPTGTVL